MGDLSSHTEQWEFKHDHHRKCLGSCHSLQRGNEPVQMAAGFRNGIVCPGRMTPHPSGVETRRTGTSRQTNSSSPFRCLELQQVVQDTHGLQGVIWKQPGARSALGFETSWASQLRMGHEDCHGSSPVSHMTLSGDNLMAPECKACCHCTSSSML